MEKEELRFSLFLLSSHLTTIMLGWCWNVCFCWLQVEGMYNIIADLLGKQWFQMISGCLFLKNPLWCRRMLCLALAGCDTKEAGSKARELANEKYTKIFLHLQVDIQIHVNSLCLKMTGTHMSALFFGVFRPALFPYAYLWGFDFSHTHSLLFTCQKANMESLLGKGHLHKTHELLSSPVLSLLQTLRNNLWDENL